MKVRSGFIEVTEVTQNIKTWVNPDQIAAVTPLDTGATVLMFGNGSTANISESLRDVLAAIREARSD